MRQVVDSGVPRRVIVATERLYHRGRCGEQAPGRTRSTTLVSARDDRPRDLLAACEGLKLYTYTSCKRLQPVRYGINGGAAVRKSERLTALRGPQCRVRRIVARL